MSEGGSVASDQRIDKWLWHARVVKSRTLAAGLVSEGKVRLNRVRCEKPSQLVRPGDVLTIAIGARVRVLEVAGVADRRGPASEAQRLYLDRTPPPPPLSEVLPAIGQRDSGAGRPTKRDRRLTDRFRAED